MSSCTCIPGDVDGCPTHDAALLRADRDALRAEVERLKKALEQIPCAIVRAPNRCTGVCWACQYRNTALAPKEENR
jgi:hypothetical protein